VIRDAGTSCGDHGMQYMELQSNEIVIASASASKAIISSNPSKSGSGIHL